MFIIEQMPLEMCDFYGVDADNVELLLEYDTLLIKLKLCSATIL